MSTKFLFRKTYNTYIETIKIVIRVHYCIFTEIILVHYSFCKMRPLILAHDKTNVEK